MAKALTLEQAFKVFLWMVVASVLLFAGPQYAYSLLWRQPEASEGVRWVAVAISTVSLVPWLAYVGWGLAIADEYHRHILLVGTSLAFAFTLLYSVAIQTMADGHLIDEAAVLNLPVAFVIWVAGVACAFGYQRVRR